MEELLTAPSFTLVIVVPSFPARVTFPLFESVSYFTAPSERVPIVVALVFTWVSRVERLEDNVPILLLNVSLASVMAVYTVPPVTSPILSSFTVPLVGTEIVIIFLPSLVVEETVAAPLPVRVAPSSTVTDSFVVVAPVVSDVVVSPIVAEVLASSACTATPTGIARLMDKTAITMPRVRLPCLLKTVFSISGVSDLVRPLASSDTT